MPGPHPDCRALTVACIDYRFVEPLRAALDERGLLGATDLIHWPGGALRLTDPEGCEAILEVVELARSLHAPEQIVLSAHPDCGWVGGSERFHGPEAEHDFLDASLADAAGVVSARFSTIEVSTLRLEHP